MKKFENFTSIVTPLPLKDIDTDMIIPAQFLTSISKEGYGQNLFKRFRESDVNFPLNQAKYKGSRILVADSNFGCGSSREHAVWALKGAGFDIVIAKSFADIFTSNSAKNGLLLVTLAAEKVDVILENAAKENYSISVDLEDQSLKLPGNEKVKFEIEAYRKHCMLNGLDDLDYILSHKKEIDQFWQKQKLNLYMHKDIKQTGAK